MKKYKVQDIRDTFVDLYRANKVVNARTTGAAAIVGSRTIEITAANFIADEPTIFGKPSSDYIVRELAWYNSQSLNVYDIPGGPPKIWAASATPAGFINSNYGWTVFSEANGSQFEHVKKHLLKDPNTRQAVLIYTRPSMHVDAFSDGKSDFMCTNTVQFLIRDDKLLTFVNMRSNDAFSGYRNDLAWQHHVTDKLLYELKPTYGSLTKGPIDWFAGSLHFYERDWPLIQQYIDDSSF
jgi:thymidylate synthase